MHARRDINDPAVAVGGGIGAGPARAHRRASAEHRTKFIEDQRVDRLVAERIGRRGIMVAVTDNQAAIGALRDDQVDAVREMIGPLGIEPRPQRRRLRECGIAQIADQTEVRHHRTRQAIAGRFEPQHLELAARDPGERLREQRDQIVAGANDDGIAAHHARAGIEPPRLDAAHRHPAPEFDPERAA